jgi:hypothetical protein
MNSTLIIIIVFILVFVYLYWQYKNEQKSDKFTDVSLLVEPDYSFINNNDFINDIIITVNNINNFNRNFAVLMPNLQKSSDRMAISKLINDKIYSNNLTYLRDKQDNKLIYKLYKRRAIY